ncbi:MAG TPA: DegT/DnrJ/EryC1/StrS aminotransferase family protein [Syntrophales bacterium]|nr:DegT/DnrJ/EryC1/StrS aminotransferase family protein [Syntrophales bacterium]HQN76926.1 DegT/DnrJ/EryC1/StrS aminotransferase family protein [Syntrophales bacterium]HQQ26933.1 DegT/DnrJ/EryC1/StrS aminotransferase family protein [Syntrophales bacterium]
MRKEFLSFSPPLIGEEEIQEVVDTLRSDWITTGPKTKRFEEAFARFVGAPGALGLNSCTAGLHTALVTAGIGPGDEVVTTTLTFAATVNVIEQVGARPVLVDVEPDTLNMDPRKVEACLSGKTKAIIPVHYAGHPVEMDGILDLARSRRLLVLEDAAHALPARYRGRFVGSGSNPASFSFYATKNLTTGEGGMLTADPSFLERARIVSLHGMSRDAWKRYDKAGGWFYEVVLPGFKYNMTDIQASLGLHQLKKLEAFQKRRRRLVEMYQEAFRGVEALEIPVEKAHVEHAWYLYVLRIVPETLTIHRDRFIEELKERNIGTSVHFIPIHFHPYYRDKYGYGKRDFPVARGNYERMMSLPLNLRMTDGDVADVVEAVLEVVRKFRR